MARNHSRYQADRGLSARMGLTMFLLGLLFVVLGAVLVYYFSYLGLVLIGGFLVFQWFYSDRIALYSMGGREVTPEEAPQLHAIVDRLCALADMPKPKVAIADTDVPNAFATGRSPPSGRLRHHRHHAPAGRARARGRAVPRALARGAPRRDRDDAGGLRRRARGLPDPDGALQRDVRWSS